MVFFQGETCHSEIQGKGFPHIADMPGLPGKPGDRFLSPGIADHKAVKGSVLFQPAPLRGIRKGFLQLHVDLRTGKIQGKTGLVFAGPGRGDCRAFPPEGIQIKLLLPFIGTIAGYPYDPHLIQSRLGKETACGFGGLSPEKPLFGAGRGVESDPCLFLVVRYVSGVKKVVFIY